MRTQEDFDNLKWAYIDLLHEYLYTKDLVREASGLETMNDKKYNDIELKWLKRGRIDNDISK